MEFSLYPPLNRFFSDLRWGNICITRKRPQEAEYGFLDRFRIDYPIPARL